MVMTMAWESFEFEILHVLAFQTVSKHVIAIEKGAINVKYVLDVLLPS